MKTTIEVTGTITDLYCQRPAFCAGKFVNGHRSDKFRIKGWVRPGQTVTFIGNWVNDEKWGKQFDAVDIAYKMPTDLKGLKQWLAWEVQGIGPVTAAKLVDEYGEDLPRLAIEDAGQVAATCGVGREVVEFVAGEWQKGINIAKVKSKLAGIGLTKHQVEQIVDKFRGTAVEMIEQNPYVLLGEIDGVGFKVVDQIAMKAGMTERDPRRMAAAIQWVVKGGYHEEGHTAVSKDAAYAKAEAMLGCEWGDIDDVTSDIVKEGKIVREHDRDGTAWYATPAGHRNERRVWDYLKAAKGSGGLGLTETMEPGEIVAVGDYVLDESQSRAVYAAQENRISVVTGGAGSGKTLVARAIYKHFKDGGRDVFLVAPTGKAARRLSEVIGVDAATIHRTLGFNPDGSFNHDENNPLPDGLYIVDEFSMVATDLMSSFIRALPKNSATVLIGDENQLPPVGPGAILRDMIANGLAAVTKLEKCHRQAGTLKRNCSAVLAGVVEPTDTDGEPPAWVVHQACPTAERTIAALRTLFGGKLAEWGFDPIRDTQFMTAMHKGVLGTKYLNKYMQWLYQAKLGNVYEMPNEEDDRRAVLYVGDKVIHVKNNYKLNVMNGTVGFVRRTMPLTVDYDDGTVEYADEERGQVELGYVLTPHKCQGSEFPCAVTIMPKAHGFMMTKNWFYTAVTRAKKMAVVVGEENAIRRAATTVGGNNRMTLLQVWAGLERKDGQPA